MSSAFEPPPVVASVPDPWRWTWHPYHTLDVDMLHDLLALRQAVFVVEQNCAYLDITGADRVAWHLCLWQKPPGEMAELVAYARAFHPGAYDASNEAVIGRVVVAPGYRRQGLGRAVVAEALNRLFSDLGPVATKLSAQAHLEELYASLGFVTNGPGFLEDGIPHLPMRRPAIPAPPVDLRPTVPSP